MLPERQEKAESMSLQGKAMRNRTDIASHSPAAMETRHLTKYRLTAAPLDPDSGLNTFCSYESGTLRFVTGGKSSTSFSRGQVLDPGAAITAGQGSRGYSAYSSFSYAVFFVRKSALYACVS